VRSAANGTPRLGAWRCWRQGYAWEGANFWRALFGRLEEIARGGELRLGWAELCFVACGTLAALAALIWSLRLATTNGQTPSHAQLS
jgi:hypothetical protein